jgi:hypothetical protein
MSSDYGFFWQGFTDCTENFAEHYAQLIVFALAISIWWWILH